MANGPGTLSDARIQADFEIPASSTQYLGFNPAQFNYNPQFWVRRTSNTGDGGGYGAFFYSGTWTIFKHAAGGGNAFMTLATGTSTLTMATGTWYTGALQVANNASGTPVLNFWVYPQGGTQPAQPMVTAVDASSTFQSGYFGLGTCLQSVDFTNISVQATDTAALAITSPARAVAASSSVATLAITNSSGNTFYIPYIQTSSTLPVTATVGSSYVPNGGGVKFVLTNTSSSQTQTLYSTGGSSPYTVSFTNLAKGTYTLDTFVVNASDTVQNGLADHDQAIDIGIGDIITAVGDSITAGYPIHYTTYPAKISDWTQALSSSTIPISLDDRNYPQQDYFNLQYEAGYVPQLNNMLSAYYGYPVFIMNEGVSSYQASSYATYMTSTQWANRESALAPNKWMVNLGVNDANASVPTSTYATNMQTIISDLINVYHAAPSQIMVAKPMFIQSNATSSAFENAYLPQIDALVAQNHLSTGPNFYAYYQNYYPALYNDPIHPNAAGYAEMADLWSLPFMSPQNVQTSQHAGTATLIWNSLSGYNPQVDGYKIEYGIAPGNYTTTIDVGNVTTGTVAGLTGGQSYYFTVLGYYSDSTSATVNPTAAAGQVSMTVVPVPNVAITAIAPGASVTGTVPFAANATATSPASISSIQFLLDGTNFGSAVTSSPYATSWNTDYGDNGQHTLTALALDTYGDAASTTVGFTVANPPSPVVSVAASYAPAAIAPVVSSTPSSSVSSSTLNGTSSAVTSSTASLTAQLEQLQALFSSLSSKAKSQGVSLPSNGKVTFTRNLGIGSKGSDITALQSFLIGRNTGTFAKALASFGSTGYFGLATQKALAEYQINAGIKPAVGYLGLITRAYINGRL